MADADLRDTETVSRLLANIKITLLGLWDGKPVRRPLGEMKLKSEIFRPKGLRNSCTEPGHTVVGVTGRESPSDGGIGSTDVWPNLASGQNFVDPVQTVMHGVRLDI